MYPCVLSLLERTGHPTGRCLRFWPLRERRLRGSNDRPTRTENVSHQKCSIFRPRLVRQCKYTGQNQRKKSTRFLKPSTSRRVNMALRLSPLFVASRSHHASSPVAIIAFRSALPCALAGARERGGCFGSAGAWMIGGGARPTERVGHGTCARPRRQSGGDRDPHRAERGGTWSRFGGGLLRGRRRVPARRTCGPGGARAGARGCRVSGPGGDPRRGRARGVRRVASRIRLPERERVFRAPLRGPRDRLRGTGSGDPRSLRDKARARTFASECGVPVLPGTAVEGGLETAREFLASLGDGANGAMIKAAGGGGRARDVRRPECRRARELVAALPR